MKTLQIPDLDALFNQSIVVKDGMYTCPVCGAAYKSEKWAHAHLEKQSCADFHTIYDGTEFELLGAKIFKYILAEVSPSARPTISTFLKSPSYNPVMRFVTFLYHMKMQHMFDNYISWLILRRSGKYMNQILKYGVNYDNLFSFKLDMHALDAIDCVTFIESNIDRCAEDQEFFVSSIERCRLGVLPLLALNDFEPIIDALQPGYKERLYDFIDSVMERKALLAAGKRG